MAHNYYTNWVCRCLATGLNAYSSKDSLNPFLLVAVRGRVERRNFTAATDEEALRQARQLASSLSNEAQAYGVVWFQTLTTNGVSGPAIIVEAACQDDRHAQLWARRFSTSGLLGKLASPPTSIFFGVRVANALNQPAGSQENQA